MRASNSLLILCVCCLTSWAGANPCSAQTIRRYQPATPTVSPYLNLNRANAGGLPNYYALVRPLERQQQVNLAGQRLLRQQGLQIGQLQQSIKQGPVTATATGTSSRYFTSGTRAAYGDTLHYYQPLYQPVAPRR